MKQHKKKDDDIRLTGLTEAELRDVMFARLQGDASFGPAVDPRVSPETFEWLSEQFRRGDAGLQLRMSAILGDFLEELPDTTRWPERARYGLLDLIQDCGESLVDHLHRLIGRRTFLKSPGLGPDVHAALLKCLISNGHHATPDFWLDQFDILGPEFGALIFSGLTDHGLAVAMSYLPGLCDHPQAKSYVRWLLPHLQDKFGTTCVLEQLDRIRRELPEETYQLYHSDLLPTIAPENQVVTPVRPDVLDDLTVCPIKEPISDTADQFDLDAPDWLLADVAKAKANTTESPRQFSGLFPIGAA